MSAPPNIEVSAPAPGLPASESSSPLVLLVGNPNTGKTTLFNKLTGQNARIGNYPGVTVERRSASVKLPGPSGPLEVEVVDVPGAYSLSARSAEEQLALASVLGLLDHPVPDLCVVVVDAGQLARNLYLVMQLLELGVPSVIALNMIDEVADNPPNPEALTRVLGVPCVSTDARRGRGLAELARAVGSALRTPPRPELRVEYPEALERDLTELEQRCARALPGSAARARALALWALSSVEPDDELKGVDPELRAVCLELRQRALGRDIDREVIAARYAFIDRSLPELYRRVESHPPKRKASERVDRWLLHPVFGFVIFVTLMLLMFQALFTWSDPAIRLIEDAFSGLGHALEATLPPGVLRDLLTRGVIGGVGNVLVFLPQILLLFLFIGLLEDSGYMARVAFLMDRIMKALGLHGRAFVPMLSGFACAVPAILATRTMERQRDRLLTMLVIPLMTCSARLPVYTLIIGALFPPTELFGWLPVQGLLMVAMYVFSTLVTLIAAGVLGRTAVRGRRIPLILELPPYRMPSLSGTFKLMWERATVFVKEAGSVILVCTIALWALLSFPRSATPAAAPERPVAAAQSARAAQTGEAQDTAAPPGEHHPNAEHGHRIAHSYGGRLGKAIEPLLAPLGFDWKIGVGLIGAFAAREVFVSTLGLVYGIGDGDDAVAPLREKMRSEQRADGRPVYSPLVGLCLMIFFALSCQCMSTLAVVRRETHGFRWPAFMFAYMTGMAYVVTLLVYQAGRALGF